MKFCLILPVLLAVVTGASSPTYSAENAPTAADLVPGDAPIAIHVRNAAGLRQAIAASDFGKLWAEPDMQAFAKPAWTALLERYAELRKEQPALPDLADLDKAITGGIAIAIAPPANGPPKVGIAVQTGDLQAASRLLAPVLKGKELAEGAVITLGPPDAGPALVYEKGFVLAAFSPQELSAMRARLADPAKRADGLAQAKAWTGAEKLLGGAGHATVVLNVEILVGAAMSKEGAEGAARAKKLLSSTGIAGVKSVAMQLGSRGSLLTMDLAVPLEGPPAGIFAAMAEAKPIPASALKIVPAEASFCSVSRTDLTSSLKLLRSIMEDDGKDPAKEFAELNELLGLDLEKDIVPAFGDTWVFYDVGGTELFGFFPGFALAVDLKDAAKAAKTLDAAFAALEKVGAQGMQGPPEIKETTFGATRVRYFTYSALPFSPAFAIDGNRLYAALSVPSMRRALKQLNNAKDITATANFKEALERTTGKPLDLAALPPQFSYSCPAQTGASLQMLAQFGQMMVGAFKMQSNMKAAWGGAPDPEEQMALSVLDKLDFALFPPDEIFTRHMKPSASVTALAPGGLLVRTDLPVPSAGALGSGQGSAYSLPIIAAIAVPNLLRSRMAANESAAIAACKTYAEAQDIYRRTDWDADGVLEYAQAIKGANSLYEKTPDTGDLTLVDAAFANASIQTALKPLEDKDIPEPADADKTAVEKALAKLSSDDFQERENATAELKKVGPGAIKLLDKAVADTKDVEVRQRCKTIADGLRAELAKKKGATVTKGQPKAGYYFKVLTGQGPKAPGGRKSYVTNGNMTLGYALVAWPANYDGTGRNAFLINNTGTVYQKDWGKDTAKICEEMTEYDPSEGWIVAE